MLRPGERCAFPTPQATSSPQLPCMRPEDRRAGRPWKAPSQKSLRSRGSPLGRRAFIGVHLGRGPPVGSAAAPSPEDAMFVSCLLSVSLALSAGAAPGMPPGTQAPTPSHTLWLVQALYPGQDALLQRTEEGIAALIPQDVQAEQLIGRGALAMHLKGQGGDLRCVSGEARCREPLEAYLESLGLERVVLVQVGQDDAGYRFRAVSVRPGTGARGQAETANPAFEKALAGVLVKFLSLNATVVAETTPAGATVFIDGVKVGSTPFTTEVLPGEHTFRFELASHLPKEETRVMSSRQQVKLDAALEKVPARLVVKAQPEGAEIRVDGQPVGTTAVDQGIQPGTRMVSLTLDGYEPHEVKAEIAPGGTYTLEHALTPTSMQSFKLAMRRRKEATMARQSYLEASFEMQRLTGTSLASQPLSTSEELESLRTRDVRAPGSRNLRGVGVEYGRYGQFFGVMLVGATYASTGDTWTLGIDVPPGVGGVGPDGVSSLDTQVQAVSLRALQPQLRYVLGPVSFAIQVGLEGRGLLVKERAGDAAIFKDGLYALDLHASGQATARIFVYEGLYASVAYQHSFTLLKKIAGTSNIRGGLGYAF
ncbi:PEGA domain-containing protein [Myxococcus xanthus]|uniref:PEGA domain-containing protein n=2 Tax=Myxococcaceae TaxID=31 RepID=A0AAE6G2P9_MYXXA|nr:PEGA domain-containing protein [Myxococcus xanthus]QDE76847.1 PEGA domain-containing protein [Myxococcus xanthus]QDE98407.1 PEGA domain-containing protein [Myxococcus xanthus]QDF06101.1 PEGA domain-containing protein [Myxococcus xanthus]